METKRCPASTERNRKVPNSKSIIYRFLQLMIEYRRIRPNAQLFSDAECGEDKIQNIFSRRLPCERIERPQSAV